MEESVNGEMNLDRVCRYVKDYLHESFSRSTQEWALRFPRSAEYRWQHTLNVLRNAELILAGEGAQASEAEVVRFAVILHDVSMFDCAHEIHGQVSATIAEKYLTDQGYPPDFVSRVGRAVAEHGIDLGPIPPVEQGELLSWAGKVVLEADILDKLGASAITGALLDLGEQRKLIHECRQELAEGFSMERAVAFKDYIWTTTGRKLAEQRFDFYLRFLEQLAEEVVETD